MAGAEAVTLRVVLSPELSSWPFLALVLEAGALRSVLVVFPVFVFVLELVLELPLLPVPVSVVPPVTVIIAPVV